jgi:hypothetical protein
MVVTTKNTTKTIILDLPSDWESWIFVVKTIANGGDVWKYINPDLGIEPIVPSRPEMPTPSGINPTKTTLPELDLAEKETFKLLLAIYKEDQSTVKQALDVIQTIRTHIVTTVSINNISYIKDNSTVYQMLVALKKRLAPTDRARKLDLIRQYSKIKTFRKNEPVDQWLQTWEKTYKEMATLHLPDISDDRALFDFTQALSQLDSTYASTQEFFLNQKIKNGESLPEIYDLIEDYRNHLRIHGDTEPTSSHSAFSTASKGASQDNTLECVCGMRHPWKKCFYLIQSIRPPAWKPDPEIQRGINQKLASDEKLKERINDTIQFVLWKDQNKAEKKTAHVVAHRRSWEGMDSF